MTVEPSEPAPSHPQPSRRLIALEIVIVLGLGLGRSAYYSLLSLIDKLTRPEALDAQTTTMNSSVVPDRPWLDLAYQLGSIVFPLFQVLLVLYLLHLAHGRARRSMGFDLRRPGRDLLTGVGWTLLIGIPGIVLYLAARQAGLNTEVAPANLAETWWTVPAYVALAAMNGIVEEVVMLGYLLTRARDLRWSPAAAVGFSAVIRGAYHLYQGFGGFVGNLLMGLIFGAAYQRWGRVMPFVIAHTLLDVAAFVGYALLSPHLSWL